MVGLDPLLSFEAVRDGAAGNEIVQIMADEGQVESTFCLRVVGLSKGLQTSRGVRAHSFLIYSRSYTRRTGGFRDTVSTTL